MRVIAGSHRSRLLKQVPSKDTRETSDKIRGAVFNSVGSNIIDAKVLDIFAGSGAYGIEALSRGASKVLFNDVKQIAVQTIKQNLSDLDLLEQSEVHQQDYTKLIQMLEQLKYKFDIVFMDPPYSLDIYEDTVNKLYPILNQGALLVLEMNGERIIDSASLNKYQIIKEKQYGNKKIIYIEKL
jgi:16S rRNA (guanine(966)-N(2))-methyltransferase RsmD